MSKANKALWAAVGAVALSASAASAATVPNAITGVTGIGSAVGDAADPNDGSQSKVVDGTGLTIGNAAVPSTWTHTNRWQDGWQHKGATSGTFIVDFGSVKNNLDKLYIWNVTESGATNRGVNNYDIFAASSPTVTPTKNVVYNFTSGGWTSVVTNQTLPQATGGGADVPGATINLASVGSARYVGIRMNSNYGGGDVGLAEFEVTQAVPEPASLSLLGLGAVGLLRRRLRA